MWHNVNLFADSAEIDRTAHQFQLNYTALSPQPVIHAFNGCVYTRIRVSDYACNQPMPYNERTVLRY